ncbi:MAG: hypothetical protein R6X27_13200, partial [Candidatus Desulfacyla sp.]
LTNHGSPLLDGNNRIQSSPLREDTPPISSKANNLMVFTFQRKIGKQRMEWKKNQKNDKDVFKIPFRIIQRELNSHNITKPTT